MNQKKTKRTTTTSKNGTTVTKERSDNKVWDFHLSLSWDRNKTPYNQTHIRVNVYSKNDAKTRIGTEISPAHTSLLQQTNKQKVPCMHVKRKNGRRILKEETKLSAHKRYAFHHVLKLLEIYPTIPIPIHRKYHLSHPINLLPFRQS